MKDIARKVDRAKEILAKAQEPSDAEAVELVGFGLDLIGELLANSRRIAVALEALAAAARP